MHVSNQDTAHWLELAREVLHECTHFYAESPLDELSQWTPEPPADFDLQEELGSREYSRYREILQKSMGIDMAMYRYMNPFWITALMSMKVLGARGRGMDELLWEQAQGLGLITGGVESARAHRTIYDQLSPQDQVKHLRESASNISKFRKLHLKISMLYREGDLHGLYRRSYQSLGRQRDLMIRERNPAMLDKVLSIMITDMRALISVGVAHLGGFHGLIRGLKVQGVSCEPISADNV